MARAATGAVASRLGQAVAAAALVMLGMWLLAPGAIPLLFDGTVPTKPTTTLALLLLGVVLGWPGLRAGIRGVLLGLVAALAAEGLLSIVLERPLLASHPTLPDAWEKATPDHSLQLAASSAAALLLVVLARVLGRNWPRLGALSGLTAFLIGYVGALGHLYGVSELYTFQTATSMAAPTVVGMLACSTAVLVHDPGLPVPRTLLAPGISGALVRRLAGWTLLLPPAEAWLVVQAVGRGWVDAPFGLSLMAMISAVGGVLLVLIGARTARRTDLARETAAAELATLNAALGDRVDAAVAEAEEDRDRLSAFLDATPAGIFETDPDGRPRYVNERWRELAGLDQEAAGSGGWVDVLHPEDRAWVMGRWTTALHTGEEYRARYRYLRADGTVVWVDTLARPVRGASGAVVRWLGSVIDVTDEVEAQRRMTESEQRYRSVVTSMAEGVVLQDATGTIVTANEAAGTLLGLSMTQLMGRSSLDDRWRAVNEDGTDIPGEEHPPMVALRTGRAVRDRVMGVHRGDGSLVWLQVSSEPTFDVNPVTDEQLTTGVVTTFADVTAARTAARALRRSEEQFRTAMEHAPIGMALVELDGRFREVNRALCRLVGYDEDELVGSTFQQITHPDDLEADLDNLGRLLAGSLDHYTMEKRYVTSAGDVVWVLLAVSLARDEDDRPAYFVSQIQDITDARAEQERLAHRALHDPLTGLPNRDLLMDHLAHALLRSSRGGSSTAVMFCDLDHFKAVNDTYGHEVGDMLLVAVADRLRAVMRPGDTVARLGGDEFVVVAEGLPDADAVRAMGERVRRSLGEPVQVGMQLVQTEASVGVAVATAEDDARSVLREADAAMYRAKTRGRARLEVSTAGAARVAPAQEPAADLLHDPA